MRPHPTMHTLSDLWNKLCRSMRVKYRLAHVEVMTWKRCLHYWPFVKGIHRWPVNSPHKGPVRQTFDISFVVSIPRLLHKQSSCGDLKWYDMWCHCNHGRETLEMPRYLTRCLGAFFFNKWGLISKSKIEIIYIQRTLDRIRARDCLSHCSDVT